MIKKYFGVQGAQTKTIKGAQSYIASLKKIKETGNLVEDNLKLVVSIANLYSWAMPIEDLIQEGNIGLIMASKTFDPSLGYTFASHATPFIRKYIVLAIESQSRVVRRPHHAQQGGANVSLNDRIGDDGCERIDFLIAVNEDNEERNEKVARMMNILDEREKTIVARFFGIGTDVPESCATIGCDLGLSDERVRQICQGAVAKMRRAFMK